MKKYFLKLISIITLALTIFVGASCEEKEPEHIDYVAELKLDLTIESFNN